MKHIIDEHNYLQISRFVVKNLDLVDRVEIVERAMRAIKESRPRQFDPLELRLFQHALDREFDL